MLESCRRSRTGQRPVQISPIWTYPVSASWHGRGIQYYRQAGHQMGVGFISVSPPPLPPLPLPSGWRLIQVMSHFFLLDSSDRMPENSMSLRTEQLFSLILWLIIFFSPVVVVVLLLFSDRLLRFSLPEIIIRIYAEIVRGGGRGFNFNNDGHFDKTQSMFLITWIF